MSAPSAALLTLPLDGIRCVAFDAVGTLIEPVPSVAQAYHRAAGRHGSRLSVDEISARFRRAFRESERGDRTGPPEQEFSTSEPAERQRWRNIVQAVIDDVADLDACFDELYAHFAAPASWRCFPDVSEALETLRAAGIEVVVASNFDERLRAVCDGLPPLRDISCRVISSEVGFRKPSRRFFEALVRAAGRDRRELLMVGDDRDNDLAGARDAGLAALLINRRGPCGPDEIPSLPALAGRLLAGRSGII